MSGKNVDKFYNHYICMLNIFYQQENYYKNKLNVFIIVEKNEKLIINNKELKIDDGNNCDFLTAFITFIDFSDTITVELYIENIFTEYLRFIDNIIETIYRRQCFQDQYLILLTRIEEYINSIIPGLINLKSTYENDITMYALIRSIIFSLFDFFKTLKLLKQDINKQNVMDDINIDNNNDNNMNKKKHKRTNSF
tara:strand:+ start:48 stop:632 length:585 start_codon:yes stop_codon:yes gene_type:complete